MLVFFFGGGGVSWLLQEPLLRRNPKPCLGSESAHPPKNNRCGESCDSGVGSSLVSTKL